VASLEERSQPVVAPGALLFVQRLDDLVADLRAFSYLLDDPPAEEIHAEFGGQALGDFRAAAAGFPRNGDRGAGLDASGFSLRSPEVPLLQLLFHQLFNRPVFRWHGGVSFLRTEKWVIDRSDGRTNR